MKRQAKGIAVIMALKTKTSAVRICQVTGT